MRLSDYKYGWIIGDFDPAIIRSDKLEIGVLHWNRFQFMGFQTRPCRETMIVLNGEIMHTKTRSVYKKGDIVEIPAGKRRDLLPIESSDVLHIKHIYEGSGKGENEPVTLEDVEEVFHYVEEIGCSEEQIEEINSVPKVPCEDVTVVMQGAIDPTWTPIGLESLRKYMKGSRVILSTWEGEDVAGLDYDEVIFNKDPGVLERDISIRNMNRQVVSSLGGIQKVKTKYVLKIRSDTILVGDDFLRFFDRYPVRDSDFVFFQSKIVVSDFMQRYQEECWLPYFVRDFWYFGLTKELKHFFDSIPIFDDDSLREKLSKDYNNKRDFSPEQVMTIAAFSTKFKDVKYEDIYNQKAFRIADIYIANNFIPISLFQSKILSVGKYIGHILANNGNDFYFDEVFSNQYFLELYKAILERNGNNPD